jgi:hypothetical protein
MTIDTCAAVLGGLQLSSGLLGIAAAALWLGASLTKTPKRIHGGAPQGITVRRF